MRSLGLILLVVGLVAACGSTDDDSGDGTGGLPSGVAGATSVAGSNGTAGFRASGGSNGGGNTIPCLAPPQTGDFCSNNGVCDTDATCRCTNNAIVCGNDQPVGQGGRANQGQGGAASTGVVCGAAPETGDRCTGGPGACPELASCNCSRNGNVNCMGTPMGQGGAVGQGGAATQGGRGNQGGRTSAGGAVTAEGGGGPDDGGAPSNGGNVSVGGSDSGEAGAPVSSSGGSTGAATVCPATPHKLDPCSGPDGVCPSAAACFCISGVVTGTTCPAQ